jgi:hypothetical protein
LPVAALQRFAPSFGHSAPAQQSWPEPPQAAHLSVALSQTYGSPQNSSPPVNPTQHASPRPPHGAQVAVWQLMNSVVQPTAPQQAWPTSPHVPPRQPPLVHVPSGAVHALPLAMHFFALLSQQPPPVQTLPSQQG